MTFNNPEAVEYGLLVPPVKGGELNRVIPMGSHKEAVEAKRSFEAREIESRIVKRTITPWEDLH